MSQIPSRVLDAVEDYVVMLVSLVMKNINEGVPWAPDGDLAQIIDEVRRKWGSASQGDMPDQIERLIIDTWFTKQIILARDIFLATLRDDRGDSDEKGNCAYIFEQGKERRSLWRLCIWCMDMHQWARCLLDFDSNRRDIPNDKAEILGELLKYTEEYSREDGTVEQNLRGNLLDECETAFKRYGWKDFTRQEQPFAETPAETSINTEGASSRSGAADNSYAHSGGVQANPAGQEVTTRSSFTHSRPFSTRGTSFRRSPR
ncbi:hypothetical protein FFLO_05926 [Filobasidium floriforme]|uniref:Uncharacterized protein n=1 Tax=Filobasidium floriforme TaxID=5210 RepID=A0A8K0JI72_9TREE|nr:uncharacterized protein HD553DRAFT_335018 [Filobasidium floriforme]KAG7528785.1 hypothetical protein FFLO_05926 [Filobasidium floriforme]KAH8085759.1 hypothetical protein HD553DRAFT_335018 [Filobasidium floriforme]